MSRPILIALALLAAAAPAAAQTFSSTLASRGVCYSRTYDRAHLAAHPRQTVRTFFVGDAGPAWRASVERGQVALAFGFRLIGRQDVYHGIAVCTPRGATASCYVEGDGGSFTLAQTRTGVRVTVERVQLEGEQDFSSDIAQADNRVMLLNTSPPARCAQP